MMNNNNTLRKRNDNNNEQQKEPLIQKQDKEQRNNDNNDDGYDPKVHKPHPPTSELARFLGPSLDWKTPLILSLLAIITRLYQIGKSNIVVWDEAHFGKFASHYIKREFYFDVHPPLGKILLGFAGVLAGYNGTFPFESGATYPEELNYSVMRVFCSIFGALMVPLAYFTAVQLKMSRMACVLCATMVLLDLALLTISRFILLDSMLLFFTCLSVFCLVTFRNYQIEHPLSNSWWFWLAATGFSIGCVASVKWVGLFAIALVGLHTLEDLWEMLGDLKMPQATYLKHWAARVICLILLPISIYLFSFWLHFFILDHSGSGDAQMSSLFQAGLRGNSFDKNPLEIAYGSKVTLKNNGHGGGLLHSHIQRYPTGSEQQQITCYHHKDTNNDWIITRPWKHIGTDQKREDSRDFNKEKTVEFVNDGDIIRLVHEQTQRHLHSHNVKAPVTNKEYEVSCYGNRTVGDKNDHWRIEIAEDLDGTAGSKRVRSLSTRFRLRHVSQNCLLHSHGVTLPQWGFKQAEVFCQKAAEPRLKNNLWNVELHSNKDLPPAGPNVYKSSFFKDVVDLNAAMWTSNNALTPDPDKEPDALVSDPYQWALLLVGLRMCSWAEETVKYFLLGHPLIWWGAFLSMIVFVVLFAVYLVRQKVKILDFKSKYAWDDFLFAGKIGFVGWALHYLPFWIMGRVTYIHHYFPALYFGIILQSFLIDHISRRLFPSWSSACMFVVILVLTGVFWYFKDFAYGFTGKPEVYANRRWVPSWKFYDMA